MTEPRDDEDALDVRVRAMTGDELTPRRQALLHPAVSVTSGEQCELNFGASEFRCAADAAGRQLRARDS